MLGRVGSAWPWSVRRRVLFGLSIVCVGVPMPISYLLASMLLHPPRTKIRRTPAIHHLAFEPLWLTSHGGTRLAAWFVPCPGARASVVLCHGYPMNREDLLDLVPPLHRAGFHVLMFDFRALGESEGQRCTFGREEPEDVLAAVRFLQSREELDPERIGVLGLSMGAASCLIAAARADAIRAVVADSAFAELAGMTHEYLSSVPSLLRRPLAASTESWAERMTGFKASEVAPVATVAQIAPRPILFIHGDRDALIPVDHARRLASAAGSPHELWIVPDAGHARGHSRGPEEYERRVVDFFRRHLHEGVRR
jgi:dipeptidyl aminopeptidase/acylaminoacyl peptidase